MKSKCSRFFSRAPGKRKASLINVFYNAERKVFKPHTVRKSFAGVGLRHWDPQKTRKNCLKHAPANSEEKENGTVKVLIDSINIHKQRQETLSNPILSDLEPATVTDFEKYKLRFSRMMMTLKIWLMKMNKMRLNPTPQARICRCSHKPNDRANPQAIARLAAQEGARKVTFARKNGSSASSAKRTSVLVMLKSYINTNANTSFHLLCTH